MGRRLKGDRDLDRRLIKISGYLWGVAVLSVLSLLVMFFICCGSVLIERH
jgi:hypothetical protein